MGIPGKITGYFGVVCPAGKDRFRVVLTKRPKDETFRFDSLLLWHIPSLDKKRTLPNRQG